MKTKSILAILVALLTACASPVIMPNGQPLPKEQNAALAALRSQKDVTITSTAPDHIAWKTAPHKGTDATGRPYVSTSSAIVGFRNGKTTGANTQNVRMHYTDMEEQMKRGEAIMAEKMAEIARKQNQ